MQPAQRRHTSLEHERALARVHRPPAPTATKAKTSTPEPPSGPRGVFRGHVHSTRAIEPLDFRVYSTNIKQAQRRLRVLLDECNKLGISVPAGADDKELHILRVNAMIHKLETLIAAHKAKPAASTRPAARPTPTSTSTSKPAPAEPSEIQIRSVMKTGVGSRRLATAIAREQLRRQHRN